MPAPEAGALLVDTNLLLLYLVGHVDRDLALRFKNTQQFSREDFEWLCRFVGRRKLVATPHVLTEVSNLGGQLSGAKKERFFEVLAASIPNLDERLVPSREAVGAAVYHQLGLTDAAIERVAQSKVEILSTDAPLVHRLQARKFAALNFWHLRLAGV